MTKEQFKKALIALIPNTETWLTDENLVEAAIYTAVLGWAHQFPENHLTIEMKPHYRELYNSGDFKFDPEPGEEQTETTDGNVGQYL
jgi:hypothetical protein